MISREETFEARVIEPGSGRCQVVLPDGSERLCQLPGWLAEQQRTRLAVGDRVRVSAANNQVTEVLPRTSVLCRPGPGARGRHEERVIAANVDCVVVVASLAEPALRPRLIDRYLVAILRGGSLPLLCLNKRDLLIDPRKREKAEATAEIYRALPIAVEACSARVQGDPGVAALRARLRGQTAVLVGQSGVGKSSLLNALQPELALATREVARATSKGRHTTRASTLYRIGNDTELIDTPGIREFGLAQLTRPELEAGFPDLTRFAGECRFSDCRHLREPECAVKSAAEAGQIAAERLESYHRLLEEAVR